MESLSLPTRIFTNGEEPGLVVFYPPQPNQDHQQQQPQAPDQRVNALAISSGRRCLIVRLDAFDQVTGHLSNFLSNPGIRFMGFGSTPLHLGRGLTVGNYHAFPVTAFPTLANRFYSVGHRLQPSSALRELTNWPLTMDQVANATLLAYTSSFLR